MKCPKCGYLGFEEIDRCRNCGYEFSLIWPSTDAELAIRSEPPQVGPLDDLQLATPAVPSARPPDSAPMMVNAPPLVGDLPLFEPPEADDRPLIAAPASPRAPLAVRRATPEVPRLKDETSRAPLLDFEPPDSMPRRRRTPGELAELQRAREEAAAASMRSETPAGLIARMIAVCVDLVILLAIDALVVYFTIQICGLTPEEVSVLPKGPMLAFLIVQNGGYLVAFTLGGQTLGKMLMGIKVVADSDSRPLDLGRAIVRTLVWMTLVIPAGLGFVTALFSRDRRGLHDRCAGTRVVRVA